MSTDARFEDGKLILTRVYAASREEVFDAWVETSKVQRWWGCAEATAVRSSVEPRVGGRYDHTMTVHGMEIPGAAVFTVFERPARLAFRSESPVPGGTPMLVTVDFAEVAGGTRVRLVHEGIPDVRVHGDVELRSIIRDGWTAGLGKLARVLGEAP